MDKSAGNFGRIAKNLLYNGVVYPMSRWSLLGNAYSGMMSAKPVQKFLVNRARSKAKASGLTGPFASDYGTGLTLKDAIGIDKPNVAKLLQPTTAAEQSMYATKDDVGRLFTTPSYKINVPEYIKGEYGHPAVAEAAVKGAVNKRGLGYVAQNPKHGYTGTFDDYVHLLSNSKAPIPVRTKGGLQLIGTDYNKGVSKGEVGGNNVYLFNERRGGDYYTNTSDMTGANRMHKVNLTRTNTTANLFPFDPERRINGYSDLVTIASPGSGLMHEMGHLGSTTYGGNPAGAKLVGILGFGNRKPIPGFSRLGRNYFTQYNHPSSPDASEFAGALTRAKRGVSSYLLNVEKRSPEEVSKIITNPDETYNHMARIGFMPDPSGKLGPQLWRKNYTDVGSLNEMNRIPTQFDAAWIPDKKGRLSSSQTIKAMLPYLAGVTAGAPAIGMLADRNTQS